MFFEQDCIAFQILDVLYLEQKDFKAYNQPRKFDALSFRYRADTLVEYPGGQLAFSDNSVGFFPAGIGYTRAVKTDTLIAVHFHLLSDRPDWIEQFLPENPGKYQLLFREILECWNRRKPGYKHDAAVLLNRIFSELYKDHHTASRAPTKIDAAIRYMEENYLNPDFSLTAAAKYAYISDTYFRKLFREKYGVSPKQYIIRRRLEHAGDLIVSGYYTLTEIAELCGYRDYKHFLVEFKKRMGVSPSNYISRNGL